MRWPDTQLPWVPTSPAMPSFESAQLYAGTCLFEATNLSVGRGTDAPFQQIGAPWLDAGRVAAVMAGRYRVRVTPVRFTPRDPGDGKFAGVAVTGLRFPAADRRRGDPIRDALRLLEVIGELQPDSLRVDSVGIARRLGVRATRGAGAWPEEVRRFLELRRPYLLYW